MLWILVTLIAVIALVVGVVMVAANAVGEGLMTVFCALVFWGVFTFFSWVKIVQPGEVMVARSFGSTVEETWGEGLHFVPAWYSTSKYSTIRHSIDMTDAQTISGAAQGGVELSAFDVSFPYEFSPELAWKVYREIRDYDRLLLAAARSAGRDTLAQFTWEQIAYESRSEVAEYLTSRFQEVVVNDLITSGFTEEEASSVFVFYPAQIREVTPPQRILNENAELAAAEVALQRQEVLTRIAEQEAERRRNEGSGIQNLWNELPDASAEDIAMVLGAIANKTRADAMMRAVEDGEVNVLVLNGQEVSVPTQ